MSNEQMTSEQLIELANRFDDDLAVTRDKRWAPLAEGVVHSALRRLAELIKPERKKK